MFLVLDFLEAAMMRLMFCVAGWAGKLVGRTIETETAI